jgi:hypothetical protein
MPLDPPIHEIAGDELSWALEPLTDLAGERGCSVAYEPMPADHGGYYRPADRAIRLAEGKAPNHGVHTLIHELAHARVAAERRDAENGDPIALDYTEEELVVEAVTYTVAGALGPRVDGYAIPYLALWSEDTDLAVIEDAAGLIDRLGKRIEDAVLPLAPEASTARAERSITEVGA